MIGSCPEGHGYIKRFFAPLHGHADDLVRNLQQARVDPGYLIPHDQDDLLRREAAQIERWATIQSAGFKRGFGGELKRAAQAMDRVYNPLLYWAYLRFIGNRE